MAELSSTSRDTSGRCAERSEQHRTSHCPRRTGHLCRIKQEQQTVSFHKRRSDQPAECTVFHHVELTRTMSQWQETAKCFMVRYQPHSWTA